MQLTPAVWFPTVRTNTGTDIFTQRLVKGMNERGIQAEITWLPLRAEYAPWTVAIPKAPAWATLAHINTWLHPKFIPRDLPLVATIHHALHHASTQRHKGWLRACYHKYWIAPIERHNIQQADKMIAVSQFVTESAKLTLADVPMHIIYNGINTEVFKPINRGIREKDVFRLLYIGSWKKLKGVNLLAPIMRELGEKFELCYTGGRAAEKDKAQMPPTMIDIGRLQGDAAIAAAMQKADALLLPSCSEGFGLVAIEAMACGLPVVASRIGPLIEVITHGQDGLLCPMNDVAGFTTAIRNLSTNQALYETIRRMAPNRIQKLFSENAMMEKYLDVYCNITSTPLRCRT